MFPVLSARVTPKFDRKNEVACVIRRSDPKFIVTLHYPRPIQERQTIRTNCHITIPYWSSKIPKANDRKKKIRRRDCL